MNRRDRRLGTLALFALLAAVHTWPLVLAPGTFTRHDNADTYLNQWILAWIAHAIPLQPLHLFDANIFYPEPHSLAFSEHLFVQGVMGAPLAWLGASPVLEFNLVLLAGLALTGWATALVVARWTGDSLAGLLAGSVAAFNTHTMSRLSHMQAMHVEFLPIALLALDQLLVRPSVRRAFALAGWSVLQMLCSGYLLVFTATTLTLGVLSRANEWLAGPRARRALPLLLLAGLLAGLICVPFLIPYAEAQAEQGLVRPLGEVAHFSASKWNYLTTVGRLHYAWWSHRFYDGTDAFFPGVIPIVLALVAAATGIAWSDRRARMLLLSGTVCFALSFGPAFRPYLWLYRVFPLLSGIRAPARFGYIVIFAVGVLAGFGLAWLRGRAATPRQQRVALAGALAAVALANLEALTAPHVEFTRFDRVSPVYDVLAAEARAVVVEIPFYRLEDVHLNGQYVFNSTRYWHPLVNGYSGFTPASYARNAEVLATFPDLPSLALLGRMGVTHVVVHVDGAPEVAEQISSLDTFRLIAASRDIRIYQFRP